MCAGRGYLVEQAHVPHRSFLLPVRRRNAFVLAPTCARTVVFRHSWRLVGNPS
jgi:hypothetical protein